MNYQIIADKGKLLEFIDWLPDLEDNEKFYLSLFARKKYCKDLIKSNDKIQLKRFISDKERMFDKIKQLELQVGGWKLRDMSAPQESLVVYINPNPRCMKKATHMMGKKCWDLILNKNYNLHGEALSCIQKSKSRSLFLDFDIDTKYLDIDFEWLESNLGKDSYSLLETRGGYHLLIRSELVTKFRHYHSLSKNWYTEVKQKYPVDQVGDNMLPVPGCVQGGFTPKFLNL